MAVCTICEEQELSPNSRLVTCKNCRASMGVWGRRPPIEVLNRRRKLHIYDTRMENVVLNPGRLKIVPVVKPFRSNTVVKRELRLIRNRG